MPQIIRLNLLIKTGKGPGDPPFCQIFTPEQNARTGQNIGKVVDDVGQGVWKGMSVAGHGLNKAWEGFKASDRSYYNERGDYDGGHVSGTDAAVGIRSVIAFASGAGEVAEGVNLIATGSLTLPQALTGGAAAVTVVNSADNLTKIQTERYLNAMFLQVHKNL